MRGICFPVRRIAPGVGLAHSLIVQTAPKPVTHDITHSRSAPFHAKTIGRVVLLGELGFAISLVRYLCSTTN